MIDQDYTKDDLKKAMLNEACPNMIGFYSDMVEDFKLIDEMNYGDKAQWFYRKEPALKWKIRRCSSRISIIGRSRYFALLKSFGEVKTSTA